MITVNTENEAAYGGGAKFSFMGLKAEKPTTGEYRGVKILNASTWQDIEDGTLYCYDEANGQWHQW